MIPNELIIIGGGASIKHGINLGLHRHIQDRFTCGLNYSYKYFTNSTYHCYVDRDFYSKQYSELASLGLIIGKEHRDKVNPNTITLSTATKYYRNLQGGVYSPELAGLFALSLGIYLIDVGTIYLLGYDFGEYHTKNVEDARITEETKNIVAKGDHKRILTHFYQDKGFNHRGIGKTSYYNAKNRPRDKFMPFIKDEENKKKIKIYNVSPTSRIPSEIFEKINYSLFFEKLETTGGRCNHIELRKEIRSKLKS